MKTVTFEVCSPRQAMANFAQYLAAGISDSSTRIVFSSQELLSQVISDTRWAILKLLCGAGGMSVTAIAEGLDRDIAEVKTDINALLNAGILERHDDDQIIFPYDEISLDLPATGRTTV
jgi:predicted transcriptional regulator